VYNKASKQLSDTYDTLTNHIRYLHDLEAQARCAWRNDSLIVLKPFPSGNRYVFRVDTSAHFSRGDMYALHVSALGVNPQNTPKVTFTWEAPDTVLIDRTEIKHNGMNIFYLKTLPGKNTKALYGSIRLPVNETPSSRLIIDNIFIMRHREGYHPKVETPEEN
jgi:hypothetical protein